MDEIYKYDSRIDMGEMWKIRQVQVKLREGKRENMIKKKEEAVKHRTFKIVKNKTKIRQTKARIAKEEVSQVARNRQAHLFSRCAYYHFARPRLS